MPPFAGSRLGPYEIVALLGAGGMGEVYKARDTRLDRPVALRVLLQAAAVEPHLHAGLQRVLEGAAASHEKDAGLVDAGNSVVKPKFSPP